MPKMQDITELPEMKVLVYGESKVGKSTFAGTFPTPGYIFLLEPDKAQYAGKDFEYDEYPVGVADTFDRIVAKVEELQALAFIHKEEDGDMVQYPNPDFPYKTIIIDSLTEYAALAELKILSMNRREIDYTGKKRYDDKMQGMRIQDWGVYKGMLEGFVRNIHSLPCNTIMVAHEYVKEAGDNKILKGCLSISGNFGETGAKLFNTVLRARAETKGSVTRYFMQTKPERLFTAGVWGLNLDVHWEDATYDHLANEFKEWRKDNVK